MSLITTVNDITVDYTRQFSATTGTADQKGATAVEVFYVAYTDLFPFIQQVAGGVPQQVGGNLVFPTPLQLPENPFLFAQSLTWEAIGAKETSTNQFTDPCYLGARVTVNFSTINYQVDGDMPFVSVERKGSTNFVTLPQYFYRFASGNRVDQNVGVLLGQTEYAVTFHNLAVIQWDNIFPFLGCVNSAAFLDSPPGSVLFASMDDSAENDFAGNIKYTARLSFIFRSQPWNYALNPATTSWEAIDDGSGNGPYPFVDFNQLFS